SSLVLPTVQVAAVWIGAPGARPAVALVVTALVGCAVLAAGGVLVGVVAFVRVDVAGVKAGPPTLWATVFWGGPISKARLRPAIITNARAHLTMLLKTMAPSRCLCRARQPHPLGKCWHAPDCS